MKWLCLIVVGAVGFGAGSLNAPPAVVAVEDGESAITLGQAPEAVRAAVLKIVPESAVRGVVREADDGVAVYELEFENDGVVSEVVLSEAGVMMSSEQEISADDLPAAVKDAVRAQFGDAPIKEAVRATLTFYEVEVVVDGVAREIQLNAAGSRDDDDDDEDEDE